tara:strand:- start:559 stop:720 length:162 start_codon:yes stop_codon:yes gene_type:complete
MKKPKINKNLFENWSTSDLKNHLKYLDTKLPTEHTITSAIFIEEVLEARFLKN